MGRARVSTPRPQATHRPLVSGVLVVDKPRGPTSHDVVFWARRALGTREIGHAGTLDPMATGVLVLAAGEATKLVPYLTADDKTYELELALGTETDTLDAEGTAVETAPVPPLTEARLREIASRFVGPQEQRVPAFSAVKVGGEALYAKARRGEHVEAPVRSVTVHALELVTLAPLVLRVRASKGFFVRSLGRDLARALGTVGHLAALRRLESGPFSLADAVSGEALLAARADEALRPALLARLRSLEQAAGAMPRLVLDDRAEADARAGRLVRVESTVAAGECVALLSATGSLVAIGEKRDEGIKVRRGFRPARVDG